jgi:hypothetical protein
VTYWEAARSHPFTYPGEHPQGAFALIDDEVGEVHRGSTSDLSSLVLPGHDGRALDDLLGARGLPTLEQRYPVLAYGGNRNPATLKLKLAHYGYASPGQGTVLPVLPVRVRGVDVVAGGLSGQGYLYADILADENTASTEIFAHLLLLDSDQMRVLHDSEGVRTDFYDVAVLPGVELAVPGATVQTVAAMVYVGVAPIIISPTLESPLAFAAVRATGRRFPEFGATAMLAHILEAVEATALVRATVAPGQPDGAESLADPFELASELMRYLNGQWWWRHHTGKRRTLACEWLEEQLKGMLTKVSAPVPTRDLIAARGRLLDAREAYSPGARLTFGRSLT